MSSSVGKHDNKAGAYARRMLKSEIALADAQLWRDYELMLEGQAVYLKGFLCEAEDYVMLKALTSELNNNAGKGMVNWSRHFKHENPAFSPTFQGIVDSMAQHFDVEVYATRLNFYPDATSWKPFHHDSHAYGGRGLREDFTMGASFGDTRALVFKHVASDQQFSFPQKNGDIFAFTSTVNQRFQHGVPKVRGSSRAVAGPRFSIIAWGRRRSLNKFNSGKDEVRLEEKERVVTGRDEEVEGANASKELVVEGQEEDDTGPDMDIEEASSMVWDFLTAKEEKLAKKNLRSSSDNSATQSRPKVQGGWAGKSAKKNRQGRGRGARGDAGSGGGGRLGGSGRGDDGRDGASGRGKGGKRGGKGKRSDGREEPRKKDPNQKTVTSNADVQFGW